MLSPVKEYDPLPFGVVEAVAAPLRAIVVPETAADGLTVPEIV